ncbi:MAG: hypothetical protein ACM32E_10180 [Gemmatimonadota bacterium]
MAFNRSLAFRAATHLATWLPFLYGAVSAVRHGWRPISDNAGIAIRAWDVLTSYGPVLGQPSRLARGVYDPGPLQYWLLTVPAHIDARTGVLWGAALWCMLVASLTIEAARSAAGAAGGLLAGAAVLSATLWIPGITRQPLWNPWFGLMFFMAALAAGWAVMAGRRGWWPVLMVTASVAAQAHLMYAIASGGLVLLALIVGLTDTFRHRAGSVWADFQWVAYGIAAGLVCWSAPLVQQFTGKSGNLGNLLSNPGGTGQTGGTTFGLKALAASVQPPPLWWTSFPKIKTIAMADHRSAAVGVAALVIMAVVLVAAIWPLRSRLTAAVAAVSLLISVAAMYTYAAVPAASIAQWSYTFNSVTYLLAPLLPLGVLAWITLIAGVVMVVRRVRRPAAAAAAAPAGGGAAQGATAAAQRAAGLLRAPWALPACALASVGVIMITSLMVISRERFSQPDANASVNYYVRVAAKQIEARIPGQPIALRIEGRDKHFRRRLTFALTYALDTMGYRPLVAQKYAWQLGPAFTFRGQQIPQVTVRMRPGGLGVMVGSAHAGLTSSGA